MRNSPVIVAMLGIVFSLAAPGCANKDGGLPGVGRLETVSEFDMNRYLGRWFEIARYPMAFQKGLVGVTAEYVRNKEGVVEAINVGRMKTLDGEVLMFGGRVWVPKPKEPAKLRVEFFAPLTASYWVIALDPQYQWAVVGEPSRQYLWILSRTPTISPDTEALIHQRITEAGYRLDLLQPTPQPPAPISIR